VLRVTVPPLQNSVAPEAEIVGTVADPEVMVFDADPVHPEAFVIVRE